MTRPHMALLERHLHTYQFEEHHSMVVRAAPDVLLDAAKAVAHEPDALINRLIAVREFPSRLLTRLGRPNRLPARPFGIDDFTPLGRNGDSELAYGLAGRFWRSDYGLQPMSDAAAFDRLQALPKLVLNFFVEPLASGEHRLSTTTRVWCPDAASRRSFAPYWTLIRPVSGWIRKRLLARIMQRSLER